MSYFYVTLVLVGLYILLKVNSAVEIKCEEGWQRNGRLCYKVIKDTRENHGEASDTCQFDFESELSSITSTQEMAFLESLADKEPLWVGIVTDIEKTSSEKVHHWKQLDGEPIQPLALKWLPAAPYSTSLCDECHCVFLHKIFSASTTSYLTGLGNAPCQGSNVTRRHFICKKEALRSCPSLHSKGYDKWNCSKNTYFPKEKPMCNVSCSLGYKLVDGAPLQCSKKSQWQGSLPECKIHCSLGYELIEEECVICKVGYYNDEGGQTRCKPCQLGTTTHKDTLATSVHMCHKVEAGMNVSGDEDLKKKAPLFTGLAAGGGLLTVASVTALILLKKLKRSNGIGKSTAEGTPEALP